MGEAERGIRTNPELVAAGWERRYLADPARAREAVDTYGSAGFEVHLEKLAPDDFGSACVSCAQAVCASYVVVYTRKKTPGGP